MEASTIQAALIRQLRNRTTSLVTGNVWIKGSPWESDVIAVTNAYYWHEYEIKVTRADFRQDFLKRINNFSKSSMTKHDAYALDGEITTRWGTIIPKPKSFSFVVPKGLLKGMEIPKHCGVIEYEKGTGCWGLEDERPAPTLRKPTKLNLAQIFNLAQKAATRVLYQVDDAKQAEKGTE